MQKCVSYITMLPEQISFQKYGEFDLIYEIRHRGILLLILKKEHTVE